MDRLPEEERNKILDLLNQDYSIRKAAKLSGHDKNTVLKIKKEEEQKQNTTNPPLRYAQESNPNKGPIQEINYTSPTKSPPSPVSQEVDDKTRFENRIKKIEDELRQHNNEALDNRLNQYKVFLNEYKKIKKEKRKEQEYQDLKWEFDTVKDEQDYLVRLFSENPIQNTAQNNNYLNGEKNHVVHTTQKEKTETIEPREHHDQQKEQQDLNQKVDKEQITTIQYPQQGKEPSITNDSANTQISKEEPVLQYEEEEEDESANSSGTLALNIVWGLICAFQIVSQIKQACQYVQYHQQSNTSARRNGNYLIPYFERADTQHLNPLEKPYDKNTSMNKKDNKKR